MKPLPPPYIERIRSQLGGDAEAFLHSYDQPRLLGLRLNPLKVGSNGHAKDPFMDKLIRQFGLTPVPWCPDGYYYEESARPGKHPYHQAGIYYIQEPSAMSSAELLDPQPGEVVLDLAAAPGGKTTQIAGKLGNRGVLIANEIHPARAKILSENVERMGIANAVVTNAAPDELARKFPAAFDKIMLDAPCSGEGMFRKDPDAIAEWSPEHVRMCAVRQLDILESVALMLKPGGSFVYSTCTFNREENEDILERFTKAHPAFSVQKIERLWPHRVRGEGHFAALLRKSGDAVEPALSGSVKNQARRGKGGGEPSDRTVREAVKLADTMLSETAPGFDLPPGEPVLFGDQLYVLPTAPGLRLSAADLNGLKTLRPGLHLAHLKKNRAEPAHSLALAVSDGMCLRTADYAADSPELNAYLRGEAIAAAGETPGWTAVTIEGFPLGWGKANEGQIKNHLPKGLRIPG